VEKIAYYSIHLLLPVIILIIKISYRPKSKLALLTSSLLSLAILGFLYFWGQWPLVGSYYFRYLVLGILIFVVIYSLNEFRQGRPTLPSKYARYFLIIPVGLLSVFILVMDYYLMTGSKYPEVGVQIEFPLKNGRYYVSSGGSNNLINNHFNSPPSSQRYALDIHKLGKFGGAFTQFFSQQVTNHHIFSDTVYCPCSGIIIESENSVKDNFTSSMNVDSKSGSGNFVTIDCDGIILFLCHLKMNSVLPQVNMRVSVGDPIGLVGNSGFSQEPHLHL